MGGGATAYLEGCHCLYGGVLYIIQPLWGSILLKLARFSAELKIQDEAECGKNQQERFFPTSTLIPVDVKD